MLRDVAKKKRENVGIFPMWGTPPPPVWECHVFERKKIMVYLEILGPFFGGSPM